MIPQRQLLGQSLDLFRLGRQLHRVGKGDDQQGEDGAQGPPGQDGQPGAAGVSVTAIQPQYYNSTSSSSATGGTWSNSLNYIDGRYIWTRDEITYSNSTTGYSTAIYNEALTSACKNAGDALALAEGIDEHFWYDNTGAHVTEDTQEDYQTDPSAAGGNTLITSHGMAIRHGTTELGSFTDNNGIQIGQTGESHVNLDYHAFKMYPKEANADPYVYFSDLRDASGIVQLIQDRTGNGSWTTFTLDWNLVSIVSVKINDTATSAYSVSGQVVTFNSAPANGAHVEIIYNSDTTEGKAFTLGQRTSGYVGLMSYAEGINNLADGYLSHSEGYYTGASGHYSHAEGWCSEANGHISHAQGMYTVAGSNNQTVLGMYNTVDNDDIYAVIVGNGSAPDARSNALTVDWYGGVEAGALTLHGSGTQQDPYYYTGGYNDEALMTLATRNKWHTILGEATE